MRSGKAASPANRAALGAIAVAVVLATAGCAGHSAIRDGTATAVVPVTTLPEPDPRAAIGELSPAYYIGAQDKLDIVVYKLPELTKIVTVDQAGQIALPFVGAVEAGGHTPAEVRAEIASRLGQTVMKKPDVTVAVSESSGQRITVEGAVTQPGVYPVQGKSSLLQAIALAKGTTNVANEHIVAVFRTINNQKNAAVFDVKMIRDGRMSDPVVYGNDTIVVEKSSGKVLLQTLIGVAPILNVFRVVGQTAF